MKYHHTNKKQKTTSTCRMLVGSKQPRHNNTMNDINHKIDKPINIELDSTDKLDFILEAMPHLTNYAHKLVKEAGPAPITNLDRELELYNWIVLLDNKLQKYFHNNWHSKCVDRV